MLNFFRRPPTCPLQQTPKEWVEQRLAWLIEQFGPKVFLERPVVLPDATLFPERFDYSDAGLRKLLDRVCELMGVDSREVDLEVYTPRGDYLHLVDGAGRASPSTFGGLYQGGNPGSKHSRITVNSDELMNLAGLIGTMAHELAHHRLLAEERLDPEAFDHELTTDLTAIFHGFGVFVADGARTWPADYGVWPGTDLKRPEYMTPPMCGYALAHRAWLCNEVKPPWAAHLSYEVRAAFKQGLRYLRETRESRLTEFAKP